ncbi:MAG: alkaline phosphatase family protein, partial [bacterium]
MKLLVFALDGFDPDLFERWRDELPNLSALAQQGCWSRLRSTIPPMTFPAWSSFLTGVTPDRHGILDFTERIPGRLQVRFVNATHRRFPTFLRLASEQGLKVGSITLPTTYPPEPLSGFQISGFDTPLPSKADFSYIHPSTLAVRLNKEFGGVFFGDFNESRIGRSWHSKTLKKLLAGIQRKGELIRFVNSLCPTDLLVVHVGETDTVGHHFWCFHDPESPRLMATSNADLTRAINTVYRAADRLVGNMIEQLKPQSVMIVSDHGMGGTSNVALHLNRYLESRGLLRFARRNPAVDAISAMKKQGMKWIPYRWQQYLFRLGKGKLVSDIESTLRFGSIDWSKTVAYSEELNYFPAVFLNVIGREPFGVIAPAEIPNLKQEIRTALLEWKDPIEDTPIVQTVHFAEELYPSASGNSIPDLILELNQPHGYSYALERSRVSCKAAFRFLQPREFIGYKGGTMNGAHRLNGIFISSESTLLP